MKGSFLILSMSIVTCCGIMQAQTATENSANPLSTAVKHSYENVKRNFIETAEKVPEDDYSFRPTPEIRTFAEVLNHIASSQMRSCSAILGSSMSYSPPAENASKATVVAALKASFDECDRAYDSLTDATATQPVKSYRGEVPKLAALMMNVEHDTDEYGVLTVYMRLKGIVPPSTARGMAARGHHRTH